MEKRKADRARPGDDRSGGRPQAWPTLRRGRSRDYRIFDITWEWRRSPRTGRAHRIVLMEAPDSVNVIALTKDRRLVMVEQFRHGIGQVSLEIPAGLVDPGESPAGAARRELLEETGYASRRRLRSLGWCHPNPAYATNRCHSFLIEDVERVATPAPDPGEDLRVRLVPLGKLPGLIARRRISSSLLLVGLLRFLQIAQPGGQILTPAGRPAVAP